MKKPYTVPYKVTFEDGSTVTACCGKAVLELLTDFDALAYQTVGEGILEECPNHPQPITEGERRYREQDRIPLEKWFSEHAHDGRI